MASTTHCSKHREAGAYPNAGIQVQYQSTMIFNLITTDQERWALLGCSQDKVDHLIQFAVHIMVHGHPQWRSNLKQAVLTELSARLENGLDSEVAGTSTVALILLYLDIAGQLSKAICCARLGAITFEIGCGEEAAVKISRSCAPELLSSYLGDDGWLRPFWAGEEKAPSDLMVHVEGAEHDYFQALVIPPEAAGSLIKKAEKEFEKVPSEARIAYVVAATRATIDFYHRSLVGDIAALPASRWDWRDTRTLLAGRIAWLLRELDALEDAFSRAERWTLHLDIRGGKPSFRFEAPVIL